jgi:hypothetical protein
LLYPGKVPGTRRRDGFSYRGGIGHRPTLARVYDDGLLASKPRRIRKLDLLGVVHVGEASPTRQRVLATWWPVLQSSPVTASCRAWLTDSGGAAALHLEGLQGSIKGVEVRGERCQLRRVGVGAVVIGHECHADLGSRLAVGKLVQHCPDLALGALVESGHGTRRVEYERDLDTGANGWLHRERPIGLARDAEEGQVRRER